MNTQIATMLLLILALFSGCDDYVPPKYITECRDVGGTTRCETRENPEYTEWRKDL